LKILKYIIEISRIIPQIVVTLFWK